MQFKLFNELKNAANFFQISNFSSLNILFSC